MTGAHAVHGEEFQLDGDVSASATTNVGGVTQSLDWDSFFDAGGNEKALPANFTASDFQKDFNNTGTTFVTNDTTTFATGSKDTLPIADWQCNFDNNVNSKIDVMNAYATSYTDPASGDELVYFALERNVNTGDANVAFWFLQSNVACSTTGGAADFTGAHTDGDLLVVSAFSNGGTVSTINVYRWDGDDATGSLNPTPVASGVDCRSPQTPTDDTACAAANTAEISTPWLTAASPASATHRHHRLRPAVGKRQPGDADGRADEQHLQGVRDAELLVGGGVHSGRGEFRGLSTFAVPLAATRTRGTTSTRAPRCCRSSSTNPSSPALPCSRPLRPATWASGRA